MSTYTYAGIAFRILHTPETRAGTEALLSDYFIPDGGDTGKVRFTLEIVTEDLNCLSEILEYGTDIIIHNSKKPGVHESGLELEKGMTTLIFNRATKSIYLINRLMNTVKLYNKDVDALTRDCIRVVRDLVKAIVEVDCQGVMVHAAMLESPNGRGIMLVGGKGSGKSTFSLDLIFNHGFTEVSRDRTFLIPNSGEYSAYGWPNYYNLGYLTMSLFHSTKQLIPYKFSRLTDQQLKRLHMKHQCLPGEIDIERRKNLCSINNVILLTSERNVTGMDILAENCFTPSDINYPNWHRLFTQDKGLAQDNARSALARVVNECQLEEVCWTEFPYALAKIKSICGRL